jgi:5'-nucleotidase
MKQDEKIQKLTEQRCNVILIGDKEKDLGMAKNIKYDNIIKVGYLNEKKDEWLEEYCKKFDIVIMNDQGLETVIDILKQIIIE